MTDVVAKLADGTELRFPAGTADDVIDRVVQSHLTKPENQAPVVEAPQVQAPIEPQIGAEGNLTPQETPATQPTKDFQTNRLLAPINAFGQRLSAEDYKKTYDRPMTPAEKEGSSLSRIIGATKQVASDYSQLLNAIGSQDDANKAAIAALQTQEEIEKEVGHVRGLKETKEAYKKEGIAAAAKEVVSQVPGAISGSLPQMGTTIVGNIVGAAITKTPIGAYIGGFAALYPQFYIENLASQAGEQLNNGQTVNVNRGKAAAAAAVQAGLEEAGTIYAYGKSFLKGALGTIPKTAAEKELATKTLVESAKSFLKTMAGGTAKVAAEESFVNPSQSILDRWQSGQDLFSEEAIKGYGEDIYGSILQSPLGAVGGFHETRRARKELEKQGLDPQGKTINAEPPISGGEPPEPPPPPAAQPLPQVQAVYEDELITHTTNRLNDLNQKVKDNTATDQEKAEHEFISQNISNPEALAKAYNVNLKTKGAIDETKEFDATDLGIEEPETEVKATKPSTTILKSQLPIGSKVNWTDSNDIQMESTILDKMGEVSGITMYKVTSTDASKPNGVWVDSSHLQPIEASTTNQQVKKINDEADEDADPVKVIKQPSPPKSAFTAPTLLGALKRLGGVTMKDKSDVSGERKGFAPGGYNAIFTNKTEKGLLNHIESGSLDRFLPPDIRLQGGIHEATGQPYDPGPAYDFLATKIRNGEKVLKFEAQQEINDNQQYQEDKQTTEETKQSISEIENRAPISSAPAEALTLEGQTNEEIAQQEAAKKAAEDLQAQEQAKLTAAERQAKINAEIKQRSEGAADTFELGQTAEQNITGQGEIFAGGIDAGQIKTLARKLLKDGAVTEAQVTKYDQALSDPTANPQTVMDDLTNDVKINEQDTKNLLFNVEDTIPPITLTTNQLLKRIARDNFAFEEEIEKKPSLRVELKRLQKALQESAISYEEYANDITSLLEATRKEPDTKERVRGAEHIKSKLLIAMRKKQLSPEAVKLATFFIDKNPALFKGLGISIKAKTGQDVVSGFYEPTNRIANIMKYSTQDLTAIHEFLHDMERMLPKDIQSEIRKAWINSLVKAAKAAQKAGDLVLNKYYENLLDYHTTGNKDALDTVKRMIADKEIKSEHYAHYNPSEFWAVNASKLIQNRFNSQQSVINRLKQWLKEFIQTAKGAIGLDSQSPLIKALSSLAKSDGEFKTSEMIYEGGEYAGIEAKTKIDTSTRDGIIKDSINRLKEAFKKQGRFGYHTEKNYNGETPKDIYNRRYNEMIKNNFTPEEAHKEAMWGVKNEAVNRRDSNWFAETFNPKNRGMATIESNILDKLESHPEITAEDKKGSNLYQKILDQARNESYAEFETKLPDNILYNIEEPDESDRLESVFQAFNVPETTPHDPKTTKEMVGDSVEGIKKAITNYKQDPKATTIKMIGAMDTAITKFQNGYLFFGSALEKTEAKLNEGSLRLANNTAVASAFLTQAIHAGHIASQVMLRGKLTFNEAAQWFEAADSEFAMKNVMMIEYNLYKRVGKTVAAKLINTYFEAKRARSIQNEFLDREAERQRSIDAKEDPEVAQRNYEAIKKAYDKIPDYLRQHGADGKTLYQEIRDTQGKVIERIPILSDEAIDTFIDQDNQHPELRDMMDNWTAVNHNMLDNMVLGGVISRARADKLKAIKDYVPWFRVQDDSEELHAPSGAVAALTNVSKERKFKKGETEKQIDNIVDNMINNVLMMTRNSMRNYAMLQVTKNFATRKENGRIAVFPSEGFSPDGAVRTNVVANGRRIIVEFKDPLIADSVLGLPNIDIPMIGAFAAFQQFGRRSITVNPVFQAWQVIKDAPTAAAVTGLKNPYKAFGQILLSFFKALRPNDPIVKILKSRGVGGFQFAGRTAEKEVKLEMGVLGHKIWPSILKVLDHIGDASDYAQRRIIYQEVLKDTGDELQATWAANNVIDFMRRGNSRLALAEVRSVSFMGAYANQLDVLMTAIVGGGFRGPSRLKAMAKFAAITGAFATAVVVYCMLKGDDDDYKDLDDETKLRNWIIMGKKIPMSTSYSFFYKSIVESTFNYIVSQGTKGEVDDARYRRMLKKAALDSLLGPNPIPNLIKSPLEIITNHDFFTGGTVTPRNLEGLDTFMQYTRNTSQLGKLISHISLGALSPIESDHLVRGWSGTIGALTMWGSDLFTNDKPEKVWAQNPVIGQLFLQPEPHGREDLFYDLKEESDKYYNTWTKMRERRHTEAKEYFKEHKPYITIHDNVTGADQALKNINAEMRRIADLPAAKMSPDVKLKKLNKYQQDKNGILKNINALRVKAGR